MSSKSVLRRGFTAEAERISERYRRELNISIFDPLNAFRLADHLEVPVRTVDNLKLHLPHNVYCILQDPERFSAMCMPNEDGDKVILHNDRHSKKRQQSNLMHELAHVILKHVIPDEAARLCFIFGLHYYSLEQEQEAKYLGGCLQITRPGLQWALKNNYSTTQISDYYSASTDMVNYRLRVSGVLRQRRYSK